MSCWFKPHTYGYGATPANWQGWVATAAVMAAGLAVSLLMLGWQPEAGTGPGAWRIAPRALVIFALTTGFVWLARVKTDGQWGWRWGK